jgi:pimeloyl-ACP methyl ester carboxylesterase
MNAMVTTDREHRGWSLRDYGPDDAEHRLLLLPGGLCTAAFYDDLAAELANRDASLKLVGATLPGHGGTTPPDDLSFDSYPGQAEALRADLGCDLVVGHSMGANVAIEMVAGGGFRGPVVLLSPSFSRQDESMFLRVLDRVATVLGALPYRGMLRMVGPATKDLKVTDARRAELVSDMQKNDPRLMRRLVRAYLTYLDGQPSLATRLCEADVPTWVAFGDKGDVGLADDERAVLEQCSSITLVEVASAGHMTLNEQPAQVADIVLEAVAVTRG